MDWDDLTRLATLAGHLVVITAAVVFWRRVRFSLRRRSAALIGVASSAWATFYLWVTPVYWGDSVVNVPRREFAAALSRVAGWVTVVCLLGLLHSIWLAEKRQRAEIDLAVKRLEEGLGA